MKVWLYYRLSRDEDEEQNSLMNQRKILLDYAEQKGHEIIGESFDDNVSGMHFNRDGINKIYEMVDIGKLEIHRQTGQGLDGSKKQCRATNHAAQ